MKKLEYQKLKTELQTEKAQAIKCQNPQEAMSCQRALNTLKTVGKAQNLY